MIREAWHFYKLHKWLKGGMKGMNWRKLQSRKFVLTVLASVVLTALNYAGAPEKIVDTIMYLVMAYVGVEGAIDIMAVRNGRPK